MVKRTADTLVLHPHTCILTLFILLKVNLPTPARTPNVALSKRYVSTKMSAGSEFSPRSRPTPC